MKILLDSHPSTTTGTGIGRYSTNLINSLLSLDNPLLSLNAYSTPKVIPFPIPSYHSPFHNGLFRVVLGLPLATFSTKPNILHFHYFRPLFSPKNTHLVNTVHDICFITHPHHFTLKKRMMFRFFCTPFLSLSEAIITPTQFVKSQLLSIFSLDSNKIHVIPEGVDKCFYPLSKLSARAQIAQKYHIKSPFFLIVGNIESRKNPSTIISAFLPLINHPSSPNLVFIGPLKDNKVFKPPSLYFQKRIFHLPHLSNQQLNLFYNAATSLVYYSDCEGFGLPPLEAARTKTPSILKSIPPLRETMNGHAYFASSPHSLTKALLALLSSPPPPSFITKIYKHSLRYTWENTAKKTLALYQQLIQE